MKHLPSYDDFETVDAGSLINLTPLLDVLFVVLIMFILVAPLLDVDKIALAEGGETKEEHRGANLGKPIKIYLHSDNTIYLGKHPLNFHELEVAIKELRNLYPNETPELYPDKNAAFGSYQKIKNLLEEAGFKQLDIILKNE